MLLTQMTEGHYGLETSRVTSIMPHLQPLMPHCTISEIANDVHVLISSATNVVCCGTSNGSHGLPLVIASHCRQHSLEVFPIALKHDRLVVFVGPTACLKKPVQIWLGHQSLRSPDSFQAGTIRTTSSPWSVASNAGCTYVCHQPLHREVRGTQKARQVKIGCQTSHRDPFWHNLPTCLPSKV